VPELGEVEYYRKVWSPGEGQKVERVVANKKSRIFRLCPEADFGDLLVGSTLLSSEARGKQLLFQFSGGFWLGIHLGMSGKLKQGVPNFVPKRHDHLSIFQAKQALILSDYRMFGLVRIHLGGEAPFWWRNLPPPILSDTFDREALDEFLNRHAKAPIKSVLLRQERFPGIGNWMADEVLWRARIHPACRAGEVGRVGISHLHRSLKEVSSDALSVIGSDWGDPPDYWLFNHRWKDGGICPQTRKSLVRKKIGGRMTCWSPSWQRLPTRRTRCRL
jgi:formamidopyrimidine-DNA glycosylase